MSVYVFARRRIRPVGQAPGGGGGNYGTARYVPRYTLPTGTTYNPVTGLVEYTTPSYTPPANEVLLTDQGSRAANRTLLQTTLDNSASDSLRIRLAPVTTDWGDEIGIPAGTRPGVGLYIEPASVKDGTFVRAEGQRIQRNDAGLAPFRVNSSPGAWYGPDANVGNLFSRQGIRFNSNCRNVRLVGLDVRPDPTWAATITPRTGDVFCNGGLVGVSLNATPVSRAGNVVIDRCRIMGAYERQFLRGFYATHGEGVTVMHTHIDDVHVFGMQGQGIVATEGGAGWRIVNNYLAVGGTACQHIMWGGGADIYDGTTPIESNTVRDIVVARNLFDFPQAWIDDGFSTMCHYENKMAIRLLMQGNIFRRYRGVGGNNNYTALALKYGNGAQIDNTIRANLLDDCVGFMSVLGGQRVQIVDNLMTPTTSGPDARYITTATILSYFDGPPGAPRPQSRLSAFAMEHNTIQPPRPTDPSFAVGVREGEVPAGGRIGFRFRNNILGMPTGAGIPGWYWHTDGGSNAATTWAAAANDADTEFAGNVVTALVPNAAQRIPTNAADGLYVDGFGALSFDANYTLTGPNAGAGADGALVAAAVGNAATGL